MSDLGTQLVAAAKEVEKWDWDSLQSEIESRYDLEWQFTPVGSPHTNGQAERHIRMAKELLAKQLADKKMTFGELSSVLSEVVHIINSKPYQSGSVDPATGLPLTPLHILGPRGRLAIPGTATTGKVSLKRRFDFIQSTVADFWAKYQLLVFPQQDQVQQVDSQSRECGCRRCGTASRPQPGEQDVEAGLGDRDQHQL